MWERTREKSESGENKKVLKFFFLRPQQLKITRYMHGAEMANQPAGSSLSVPLLLSCTSIWCPLDLSSQKQFTILIRGLCWIHLSLHSGPGKLSHSSETHQTKVLPYAWCFSRGQVCWGVGSVFKVLWVWDLSSALKHRDRERAHLHSFQCLLSVNQHAEMLL